MSGIISKLASGDMRTTGQSDEVVELVLNHPERFGELFAGLTHQHPGVRMRSADALEKISKRQPSLLDPYASELLKVAAASDQQEVQWHCAQMIGYLSLDASSARQAFSILSRYAATTASAIVLTFTLQAMADIAATFPSYRSQLLAHLSRARKHGSKAVINRANKLFKQF